MATVHKSKYVNLEDTQVSISNYTTTDKDIHGYFVNMTESEDLDIAFEHALKIGVIAAKNIDTAGYVHFFEKQADKINARIDEKIEELLGEDGQVSDIVTKIFGVDGQLVHEYLDPYREGSPLQKAVHAIHAGVHTDFEDLKNILGVKDGKEEEADRGTQKGKVFENDCEPLLEEIAQMHGDDVRATGEEVGVRTDRKSGDFVYDIKELKKRITWEVKDYKRSDLQMTDINEYLDDAIKNREAHYGILVSKYVESLPKKIGWFKEISDKKLVIALGTKTNSDELHPEILHIAYRWARAKLLRDIVQNSNFDPTLVQAKIKVLQEKLQALSSIQTQCDNIDDASTEINDLAENLNKELDKEFKEILEIH